LCDPAPSDPTDRLTDPRAWPVSLQSPFENRSIRVTVRTFEESPAIQVSARRGYRLVAVHLAVTNRGSGSFEYGNSQFLLVDDAGLYAFDIGWRYSTAALGDYQPLDLGPLREGQTETGWLLFEISNVARPSA
jgi:hypothetical protein